MYTLSKLLRCSNFNKLQNIVPKNLYITKDYSTRLLTKKLTKISLFRVLDMKTIEPSVISSVRCFK